jgi:hypothetical protein
MSKTHSHAAVHGILRRATYAIDTYACKRLHSSPFQIWPPSPIRGEDNGRSGRETNAFDFGKFVFFELAGEIAAYHAVDVEEQHAQSVHSAPRMGPLSLHPPTHIYYSTNSTCIAAARYRYHRTIDLDTDQQAEHMPPQVTTPPKTRRGFWHSYVSI